MVSFLDVNFCLKVTLHNLSDVNPGNGKLVPLFPFSQSTVECFHLANEVLDCHYERRAVLHKTLQLRTNVVQIGHQWIPQHVQIIYNFYSYLRNTQFQVCSASWFLWITTFTKSISSTSTNMFGWPDLPQLEFLKQLAHNDLQHWLCLRELLIKFYSNISLGLLFHRAA